MLINYSFIFNIIGKDFKYVRKYHWESILTKKEGKEKQVRIRKAKEMRFLKKEHSRLQIEEKN